MKSRLDQYAKALFIPSVDDHKNATRLDRLRFSVTSENTVKYEELDLQKLLHRYPESLPIDELESGFGRLIPVGMEVPAGAGRIDNMFVTVNGDLVLVECKLWRNHEARRKVISQIIDYAQRVAQWKDDDLEDSIKRSLDIDNKSVNKSLFQLVQDATEDSDALDESIFNDAVRRNLRLGRMLLLVVGDGIREDTASLSDYLQQHAGFHFTLGMVEMAMFKLPTGGIFVQPRILARTLNIERAIVKFADGRLSAEPIVNESFSHAGPRAMSLSEETFFEQLAVTSPDTANALKHFMNLNRTKDMPLYLEVATKSAMIKWDSPQGKSFTLGGVVHNGLLGTDSVCWAPDSIGQVELAHVYLEEVAKLVGGAVRKTKTLSNWRVVKTGTTSPLNAMDALGKPDEWLNIIERYQEAINKSQAGE